MKNFGKEKKYPGQTSMPIYEKQEILTELKCAMLTP